MEYTSQIQENELNALNGAMMLETFRNRQALDKIRQSNRLLIQVFREDINFKHLLTRAENDFGEIEIDAKKELLKTDREFYDKLIENINAHKDGLDKYRAEGVDLEVFASQRIMWIGTSLIQFAVHKKTICDKLFARVKEAQQALIASA